MFKTRFILFAAIAAISFMQTTVQAQEFPIAVGSDSTFAQGGAFDGTHYLMGLVSNHNDLSAQFISEGGSLYGPRFSLGATGTGLSLAFDGTNYLAVWTDPFPFFAGGDTNGTGDLHGQFISTSGIRVGAPFTIATGVNIKFGQGRGGIFYKDNYYFLLYDKGGNHQDHLYGQLIDKSGSLVGSPIQISSGYAREVAPGYDGTNYLMAWCEGSGTDEYIYGQFVSTQGALLGSNFLIDGSQYKSDAPLSVAFDGSRYFVAFHDQAADNTRWNLIGRFVTPSGTVAPERITIADSSRSPMNPMLAFDGTNYLSTWMEMSGLPLVKGRFLCTTGVPVDTAFTVFGELGNKWPLGGVAGFVDGQYILGAARVDTNMTDGDVYGKLLDPLTVGGNPLLGTWTKASGPSGVQIYYFNSDSVVTVSFDPDTSLTCSYGIDTSITPHRISWYADGKLLNLGIWEINGDNLTVKTTEEDTTGFPTTFGSETKYPDPATSYSRVKQTTGVKGNRGAVISGFSLMQNYPNPFNPTTRIEYRIANIGFVSLKVYNVLGQEVASLVNGVKRPGDYAVQFDGSRLASGVYFYRLQAGSYAATNKLLLLK
ncbi:MAG TPA: T9SS type A sorting domain-containing protein [Candidatus Kryptobacter bacterium]|nr:T9SS type A sorting domain-containing protein [Candidatus Kryptobacter bacterium]